MKRVVPILLLVIVMLACQEDNFAPSVSCDDGVFATVRVSGTGVCERLFVLDNGTRLEPLQIGYCGTPPLPKEVTEDPLYNFEWQDGMRVKIGYEETKAMSICMVGPIVKITCIEEVDFTPTESPEN